MERVEAFARIRDWVEPAHPGAIKQLDDLISIYTAIRDKAQEKIDVAFDDIARRIGFVVTTTVPIALNAKKNGMIDAINIDAPHLEGTMFEEGIRNALEPILNSPIKGVSAGSYKLLIVWRDALKLRLKRDWVEPAHVVAGSAVTARVDRSARVPPEVMEPVHWFDPRLTLAVDESILISAIDEVYPEFKLAERISVARANARQFIPEVQEPAHFRASSLFTNDAFVAELQQLVERFSR